MNINNHNYTELHDNPFINERTHLCPHEGSQIHKPAPVAEDTSMGQVQMRLLFAYTQVFNIKIRKIWTPEKFAEIIPKFEQHGFTIEDVDRIANSVDPNQTALIWVYTVCPDLSVQKLRTITVHLTSNIIVFYNTPQIKS